MSWGSALTASARCSGESVPRRAQRAGRSSSVPCCCRTLLSDCRLRLLSLFLSRSALERPLSALPLLEPIELDRDRCLRSSLSLSCCCRNLSFSRCSRSHSRWRSLCSSLSSSCRLAFSRSRSRSLSRSCLSRSRSLSRSAARPLSISSRCFSQLLLRPRSSTSFARILAKPSWVLPRLWSSSSCHCKAPPPQRYLTPQISQRSSPGNSEVYFCFISSISSFSAMACFICAWLRASDWSASVSEVLISSAYRTSISSHLFFKSGGSRTTFPPEPFARHFGLSRAM
mmetsp:Transcript_14605/g.28759  ORF Transcript_14605/g.28759 Transcript_14605/m.28759 type:complete len:285 (+) Transcript_14605:161-1015(+)